MPKKERTIWIYALLLKGGKCYVGQTKNWNERIKKHFAGKGSEWTQRHKPLEIIHKQDTGLTYWRSALKIEAEVTIQMAIKFGAENVRGAQWSACPPDIENNSSAQIPSMSLAKQRSIV